MNHLSFMEKVKWINDLGKEKKENYYGSPFRFALKIDNRSEVSFVLVYLGCPFARNGKGFFSKITILFLFNFNKKLSGSADAFLFFQNNRCSTLSLLINFIKTTISIPESLQCLSLVPK
jgi:hypothetical protein